MIVQWQAARSIARLWWPALVGAAAISAPAFLLGQCSGAEVEKNRQAKAEVSDVTRNGAARETAADERGRDNAEVDNLERNLTDAARSSPDALPSAGMRSFDCQRLRNAGVDAAECR